MESLLPLIIQLIAGAIGGNVAGATAKNLDMGVLINSIAGIVGGGLGGQILSAVLGAAATGELDLAGIIQSVAGGGVGGAILLAIVSVLKNAMAKR